MQIYEKNAKGRIYVLKDWQTEILLRKVMKEVCFGNYMYSV
jgi:hypothetical protein